MKKVYFDCRCRLDWFHMRGEAYGRHMRNANTVLDQLSAAFNRHDIEVLNFSSKGLPFDPYRSETSDFIGYADAIVALEFSPLEGFSGAGQAQMEKGDKPMFLFVPHGVNLFRGSSPRCCQRHLFIDPDYAALVVQNTLRQP